MPITDTLATLYRDESRRVLAALSTDQADADSVEDDRLRLIFSCCHPALSADAQVALTLRDICDLSTEVSPAPTSPAQARWHSALCAPKKRRLANLERQAQQA